MLTFDFRDFERAAKRLDAVADQIPFALARAMNDALAVARTEIIEQTWPKHVSVRNKSFIGAALRREYAKKGTLRVAIVESGPAAGRGSLSLHADGGTKRARTNNLAIPSAKLASRRTGKGVPKGMRPAVLPNSFKKGDVIYQRTGKYTKAGKRSAAKDTRGLKLMYTLKPSAPIKADVPFQADFDRVMTREVWRSFGPRIQAAMASRRK